MSEKQKMCTDLPTSILSSLFATLMFTGFHNQFPLMTMFPLNRKKSETLIVHSALKSNSGPDKLKRGSKKKIFAH